MDVLYPWWPSSNTSAPIYFKREAMDPTQSMSNLGFCSSCLWSIIQMHISITKYWSESQKRNLWISDFINLLIPVRELVPYRKAVLQASPISRSMCKNYESHHTCSITNVPNSHKGNWDRTWFGLNGQIHRPPSTAMAWTCQPHAPWSHSK